MIDTIAMSANAERVIKPRTFISPSQAFDAEFASPDRAYGCRERLSNGRASDAAWFPVRKGDSRSPRMEIMPSLAVSSSPRSADQGSFRGATESSSGATAAVPVRHAPSTGCFEFEIWSGARDLNPGPHGPEL